MTQRPTLLVVVVLLGLAIPARPDVSVTTVDLLATMGLRVNAAGPILVAADDVRHRLVVANSLTSTISIIDGATNAVRNIPTGRRGLQHLKAEALAIRGSSLARDWRTRTRPRHRPCAASWPCRPPPPGRLA